ncbi:MAG: 2'-5' RNA ligase family protein [Nocardioidaceae bacterium]|nr:2'-5' RNA ligase family protein [Nocardioidaceae bacterium]
MVSPGSVHGGDAHVGEVTVGVAVAVPEPYATELREHRASFGDTQADLVPTHVTLLPPTVVDVEQLADVRVHLGAVARRQRPFAMRLRGTGTFRPVSPVVFVAVAEGISECELLAEDVCSGPLAVEVPFPYHPHVTVAHDVAETELSRAFQALGSYACDFEVEDFALYVHDAAAGWRSDSVFRLRQDRLDE